MKHTTTTITLAAIAVLSVAGYMKYIRKPFAATNRTPTSPTAGVYPKIKIATFNAQALSDSKRERLGKDFYIPLIKQYRIFILQNIRDKDQNSFTELCQALEPEYHCDISKRGSGRSSSKEQIGVFLKQSYSHRVRIEEIEDSTDVLERNPFKISVNFNSPQYPLTIWAAHLNPEDVENEMNALEDLITQSTANENQNIIVLGNLGTNDDDQAGNFSGWHHLINDHENTSTKSSQCAYDRIIMNRNAFAEHMSHGSNILITIEQSHHCLVWCEVEQNRNRIEKVSSAQ